MKYKIWNLRRYGCLPTFTGQTYFTTVMSWYGRFYPIQAIFINIQLLNVIHLHEFVSLFTILTRRKSKYAQQANKYTTLCYLHIGCLSGSLARGTYSIDRALITCIKRDECYFGVTSANRRDFFLEKDYIGPTCAICYFSSVCIIYNFHSLFKKKRVYIR